MSYKKTSIIFILILLTLGFYFREYIPTTRSDFENLYYFFTENTTREKTSLSPILPNEEVDSFSPYEGEPARTIRSDEVVEPARPEGGPIDNNNVSTDTKDSPVQKSATLPASVNNLVPFTPQAPTGNWDQLHEEACEEASLAMAHYFLEERKVVLSKEADKDIQDLTKFINKDDVNIGDLKKAAENYYKHTGWKIVEKPKVDDFKRELATGNVIIVPLAGREIGNPYYKQPGPLYHMLVVSGYDEKRGVFITQDPGTKRGKNYEYKFQTLLNAIHDWTGDKNKIKEGASRILIVIK